MDKGILQREEICSQIFNLSKQHFDCIKHSYSVGSNTEIYPIQQVNTENATYDTPGGACNSPKQFFNVESHL